MDRQFRLIDFTGWKYLIPVAAAELGLLAYLIAVETKDVWVWLALGCTLGISACFFLVRAISRHDCPACMWDACDPEVRKEFRDYIDERHPRNWHE